MSRTKDQIVATLLHMLQANLDAWDGEEDSVRAEHRTLIESTRAAIALARLDTSATVPLWVAEFGVGYAVPDAIANDPRLVDTSWHNDIAPSFMVKGTEDDSARLRLWVQHPDPTMREDERIPRLQVCNTYTFVFESEDDADALKAIDELIAEQGEERPS